ncbi:(d)CMP kinase [Aureibacillus halotolerans]|uniref:Cytidylate kinase n=1 Tax=Aureibacillus halotolerans TaxID=1508390 RepID=A0A4V3D5V3_9BACI|nr:(d)CMP kinase [Aureibacillus halotolerans]TDQ41547.1 cytidylate kinase [Aureibacillus halotolerans]
MQQQIAIAIDGPAAAGKSTVAKKIADYFGYIYIDTGAMYRAFAWYVLTNEADPKNEEQSIQLLSSFSLTLERENGKTFVMVNDHDVTKEIRSNIVSLHASSVAAYGAVRTKMVDLQRDMAKHVSVVMDGRDIGTNVLPNADVKIFLIASAEERAERRYRELIRKGEDVSKNQLLTEILKRDAQDSSRQIAPLKKAEDAVEVDTTSLALPEVVTKIINEIRRKVPAK